MAGVGLVKGDGWLSQAGSGVLPLPPTDCFQVTFNIINHGLSLCQVPVLLLKRDSHTGCF